MLTTNSIKLQNSFTGDTVTVPIGFSSQFLLLGPWVFYFRRQHTLFAVGLLFNLVLLVGTLGIGNVIYNVAGALTTNKAYLKGLIAEGYKVIDVQSGDIATLRQILGMELPVDEYHYLKTPKLQ